MILKVVFWSGQIQLEVLNVNARSQARHSGHSHAMVVGIAAAVGMAADKAAVAALAVHSLNSAHSDAFAFYKTARQDQPHPYEILYVDAYIEELLRQA